MKHNKKRNTAFLYETLIRELTSSIINKDTARNKKILNIMKEFFSRDTTLGLELELYRTLYETDNVDTTTAEKLLLEVKRVYMALNQEEAFTQQSQLIKTINKELGKSTFTTFVPNYKDLATISQIFDKRTTIKKRMLLENTVLKKMTSGPASLTEGAMKPIDNIVYRTFVEKFNEQYSGTLREEQNNLLSAYIVSFSDNGVALKMFLNEELSRLKGIMVSSRTINEIASDEEMLKKTDSVIETISSFSARQIDRDMLKQVMKIQELAAEIEN